MFIVKLILKIVFSPIYIPYLILKWLGSGNSSSSGTSSSSQMTGKAGIPLVTIDKSQDSVYEIVAVKYVGPREIQVKYKERNSNTAFRSILIGRPKKQSGPVCVDWSKTIS